MLEPITCTPRFLRKSAHHVLVTEFGTVRYNPRLKPRIELVNGYWVCHRNARYSWGFTPKTAYSNWLRKHLGL